ncbi:MAG: HVO_2922 family protein [Halobacteriota archaeon]|uniref:HVO_2922 family protein n=1 Tax=Natronomonas sp. TaxID=2184060 RepID=UPI0039762314
MPDEETIYESETKRSRRGIASYLRRLANALSRAEPVPVNEEQTVTVTPPADPELEIELERTDDELTLELELAWTEGEGDVDLDAKASKATFELFEDAGGKWRWRLVHDNGNIIADSGEGYASKQKANQGLDSVRSNAPGAYVVDRSKDDDEATPEGGSDATFELFEDAGGKWRWRLVHDNGNIIADSGQGYASKQKAKQGMRSVQLNVRGAGVEQKS